MEGSSPSTPGVAQSRTRVAGGGWGPLQVLSARGQDVDDPEVVTAADGTSTVVFKRSYRAGVRVVHGQDFFLQTSTTR